MRVTFDNPLIQHLGAFQASSWNSSVLVACAGARAIELKPDDPDGYAFRAAAYRQKGDHDRAIADLTKAIKLDPDGPTGSVARSALKRLKE